MRRCDRQGVGEGEDRRREGGGDGGSLYEPREGYHMMRVEAGELEEALRETWLSPDALYPAGSRRRSRVRLGQRGPLVGSWQSAAYPGGTVRARSERRAGDERTSRGATTEGIAAAGAATEPRRRTGRNIWL